MYRIIIHVTDKGPFINYVTQKGGGGGVRLA